MAKTFIYSDEQQEIINYRDDKVVNSTAGAGKTSTLIGLALANPNDSFLYIVYNRSVKKEAIVKFREAGCRNVTVETAHSLAYKGMDVSRRFNIIPGGNFRVQDIAKLCGQQARQGSVAHLIFARHVIGFINLYLNSIETKLQDIDYLSNLKETETKQYFNRNHQEIYEVSRSILSKMWRGEMDLSHDTYLKFFQLTNPKLNYRQIMVDEGQDSSGNILGIFCAQDHAIRTIVGDSDQGIYGFRNAVNSLERVPFKPFSLTKSFRFPQRIADKAMEILSLKRLLGNTKPIQQIVGLGTSTSLDTRCILARSNLMLLGRAIEEVCRPGAHKFYFEGDLSSYTYMSEHASLNDLLFFKAGSKDKVNSEFIKSFPSYEALKEYTEATGDQEISLMQEIVDQHGLGLFSHMRRLRESQVPRENASLIFSTTHKAKGQEYDSVELCNDFLNGSKIRNLLAGNGRNPRDQKPRSLDLESLNEGVNLLYVAATRARNYLSHDFSIDGNTLMSDQAVNGASWAATKKAKGFPVGQTQDPVDPSFKELRPGAIPGLDWLFGVQSR